MTTYSHATVQTIVYYFLVWLVLNNHVFVRTIVYHIVTIVFTKCCESTGILIVDLNPVLRLEAPHIYNVYSSNLYAYLCYNNRELVQF